MKSHYQFISDRFQTDKVKILNVVHQRNRIKPEVKHRSDLEERLSDLELRVKKLEEEKLENIEENAVEENVEGHDIREVNEVGEDSNEEMEGVIIVASKNHDNWKKKRWSSLEREDGNGKEGKRSNIGQIWTSNIFLLPIY